jgi:hypothetical protein
MGFRMPPVRLGAPSMPRSSGARAATILGAAAVALGASALWTQAQTHRAEREHPRSAASSRLMASICAMSSAARASPWSCCMVS